MTLTLYYHPLASFCHKVLMALYETGTPFEGHIVDLSNEAELGDHLALWPVGKIPVLHDHKADRTIPETTIIIEYLAQNYPGPVRLIPADKEIALEARLWDRFFDLYVQEPMQKIVVDRLRPADKADGFGVEQARQMLKTAYRMLEQHLAGREFAAGDGLTLADCAAAPALFYANIVEPINAAHNNAAAYLERLMARPSMVRIIADAMPWFQYFPFRELLPDHLRP